MTALAIEVRGLGKGYGRGSRRVQALRELELSVPRGAVFGLVGPNGAGKTTCIKVLLGIARPDEGSVRVLGGDPMDVAVRARIGYLPENLQIPGHLNAFGLLEAIARLRGLPIVSLGERIAGRLSAVGLQPEAWRRPASTWSKGMRQRAGLAAALLSDPELLVLDEPTDGIDPLGRAAIRKVIVEAAANGTTVFLNSHLLAETEQICDHVAVLARGRVLVEGALEGLRAVDRVRIRVRTRADDEGALSAWADAHGLRGDSAGDRPGIRAFQLDGGDDAAISAALMALLQGGWHVCDVQRPLKALESILAEAVAGDDAGERP